MKRWDLRPLQLNLQSELAALSVLDAALVAARAALVAEHPDARRLGMRTDEPLPSLLVVAQLLVHRTVELQHLLDRYRRVLEDFQLTNGLRPRHGTGRQIDLPF